MENLNFINASSQSQSHESISDFNSIKEQDPKEQTNEIICELLRKFEFEKNVVTTDINNRIILKVKNREIITEVLAPKFLYAFKKLMLSTDKAHTIIPLEATEKKHLIFLNTVSKKRKRTEVQLFYVPAEIKAKGGFSEYKEIIKIGSDKIKGLKKVKNVNHSYIIDQEQSMLKQLHAVLPVDEFLDPKGLKHLGIQDAFEFGRFGYKEQESYAVGTAFQGNARQINCPGFTILVVLYQIAFGLKILNDFQLFEHDIKASNVLFLIDEKFPLTVRAVLSDVNLLTNERLRDKCKNNQFSGTTPFGISTPRYQPKTDHEKIVGYYKEISECDKNKPEEFETIFAKTLKLRRKNMISLVGQTFFQLLTLHPSQDPWPQEFIATDDQETIELFRNKLLAKIRIKQYGNELLNGVELTEEQKLFCVEITDLILNMTDLNHEMRPTANEVLEKLLVMIKNYSPSHYEGIVKNGWTNGYEE